MDRLNDFVLRNKQTIEDQTDELLEMFKSFTKEEIEKIPEIRNLLAHLIENRAEQQKLAEAIGVIPYDDLQNAMREYFDVRFTEMAQQFFDALYQGVTATVEKVAAQRLDAIEAELKRLRSVFLLGILSPFKMAEAEMVREILAFLDTQPGNMASIHAIYKHVAFTLMLPIPGNLLTNKYAYITEVLRRVSGLKEFKGFMFKKEATKDGPPDGSRSSLRLTLRGMDPGEDTD